MSSYECYRGSEKRDPFCIEHSGMKEAINIWLRNRGYSNVESFNSGEVEVTSSPERGSEIKKIQVNGDVFEVLPWEEIKEEDLKMSSSEEDENENEGDEDEKIPKGFQPLQCPPNTWDTIIDSEAENLLKMLNQRHLMIVTAEKLTGGLIQSSLTRLSSSTENFYGGFTISDNDGARFWLHATTQNLNTLIAARQMANGALISSRATISIAITGFNAPLSPLDIDLLGTICIAVALRIPTSKNNLYPYQTSSDQINLAKNGSIYTQKVCEKYKNTIATLRGEPSEKLLRQTRDFIRLEATYFALRYTREWLKSIDQNLETSIDRFNPQSWDDSFIGCGEPSANIKYWMTLPAADKFNELFRTSHARPITNRPIDGCSERLVPRWENPLCLSSLETQRPSNLPLAAETLSNRSFGPRHSTSTGSIRKSSTILVKPPASVPTTVPGTTTTTTTGSNINLNTNSSPTSGTTQTPGTVSPSTNQFSIRGFSKRSTVPNQPLPPTRAVSTAPSTTSTQT